MFVYILIFMFCILMLVIDNHVANRRDKAIVNIITLSILCIISGTRYYLGGSDYYIYFDVYNNVPKLGDFFVNFSQLDSVYQTYGFEKGYLFLNSFVKTIGFNFYGFTLIHSIIFYSCLYLGLKKYTEKFSFLIIIFLYKLFFYNTFISLRQSIAIAIFFMSLDFIYNKKSVKYFICCIVAVLFHNAAFILFPLYFVNSFKLTKKKIIILNMIFIPTILFSFLNISIFSFLDSYINFLSNPTYATKANNYLIRTQFESLSLVHTFEYLIIMYLIIKYYEKIIKISPYAEFIIKLFLVLLPFLTLLRGYIMSTREKDFFTFTYAIILEYICVIYNKKFNALIQIMTVCICMYGFFRYLALFDEGALMNYVSYLLKGISIFN